MKLTKRKGFNFFRSYYDVYNELSDKDKVAFMDALLDRQFLGIKPNNLKGMAKFAYISQTNSIDSQVKGYEDKTKTKLSDTPTVGFVDTPTKGGALPPSEQEKVQEKEKVQDVPTESEFLDYCKTIKEINYSEYEFSLKSKYDSWKENGWKDGNGNKIKNWKTKIKNTIPHLRPMKRLNNSQGGLQATF